jgi:cysteine desulfurase
MSWGARAGIEMPPAGYLDAASTEPLHPAARAALDAAWDRGWADPARLYSSARQAAILLDGARETFARHLGCRPDEVSFTGSGTHALHLAVAGVVLGRQRRGSRVVGSAVEHSAVLQALRLVEARRGSSALAPVDRTGRVDAGAYADLLTDDTVLACLQHANHEVGTVQPVDEVADACAARDIPLLVDAAQSLGRLPPPTGWSLLAASAHKWGGPPGVGVLAIRPASRWRSPSPADDRGPVPGYPAVPLVVAAAAALEAVLADEGRENKRLGSLVDRVRAQVPAAVPDVEVVGDPVARLPHLATFSCWYADGEALLTELDRRGFAVSSGSSCTSSALEPSHVLVAMGVLSHGNIRVSLPRGVAKADVDRFLAELPDVVASVRAQLGAQGL